MNEFPQHTIPPWLSSEAKALKTNASVYLRSFLEQRGIDMQKLRMVVLNTGEISASYYLENLETPAVLKMKTHGAFAEAETLTVWNACGVHVPKVLDAGVIENVQFLLLEPIRNRDGQIAPLGYEFIDAHLSDASEIGRLMGVELTKMHSAPSAYGFGGFTGAQGPVYPAWDRYLSFLLDTYREYLFSKGITERQIGVLYELLPTLLFPEHGVHIHGDFGIHNILVSDQNDLGVYIIDPDPQIGDPYTDIASIMFRLQISKIMHGLKSDNAEIAHQYVKFTRCYQALINAYFSQTPEPYDLQRSAIHQIIALLPKMSNREAKLRMWIKDGWGDSEAHEQEIYAYEVFLRDTADTII